VVNRAMFSVRTRKGDPQPKRGGIDRELWGQRVPSGSLMLKAGGDNHLTSRVPPRERRIPTHEA